MEEKTERYFLEQRFLKEGREIAHQIDPEMYPIGILEEPLQDISEEETLEDVSEES